MRPLRIIRRKRLARRIQRLRTLLPLYSTHRLGHFKQRLDAPSRPNLLARQLHIRRAALVHGLAPLQHVLPVPTAADFDLQRPAVRRLIVGSLEGECDGAGVLLPCDDQRGVEVLDRGLEPVALVPDPEAVVADLAARV